MLRRSPEAALQPELLFAESLDNAAARALNHIRLTTKMDTFELAVPTHMSARVAEMNAVLCARTQHPDTVLHNRHLRIFDVKDGFTNLPHQDIRRAVRHLLDRSAAQHRSRRWISVPKRGCAQRNAIHFGRTDVPESFVCFSMDQL